MERLNHLCELLTSLLPVARQAALTYNLLAQIGESSAQSLLGWSHFSQLYSRCVQEFGGQRKKEGGELAGLLLAGGKEARSVIDKLTVHFNRTVLQDAFR